MSSPPKSAQDIWDRLRTSTRDELILEEMIRLGFWPAQGNVPEDPADEIRRRGEIYRELEELRKQNRHLHNEAALIKEMRKRRLAESKKKRQETKERHERERRERAEAWRLKKAQEIVYLGEAVSGGLDSLAPDDAKLQSLGLPRCATSQDIAAQMGITVNELRFLAFARQTSEVTHYRRFKIPKKTGGERLISAPMPRLKAAQQWVVQNILTRVALNEAAHGFRAQRSIVSNARPHLRAECVVNIDLKDFFPSISYKRVKGMFRTFGYSEAAATIFALICTEPEAAEVELDGKRYYVALTDRHLPQGAPSSPAITNILCRRLDRRLNGLAAKHGFVYTRYADDLTFSASGQSLANICNLLGGVEAIVKHEGFEINADKTRVLRKGRCREVTGIVINDRLSVPREELRRFRATLFQIEKDGPQGKRWGNSQDIFASLLGFANFVYMVDADKGAQLRARVRALIDKHGWQQPKITPKKKPPVTTPAGSGISAQSAPKEKESEGKSNKKWWKLF